MRVAITGASGFIGRALVDALLARGDEVVAFSRAPVGGEMPGASVQPWPPEPGAFPAVDAVVHLAGESVAGRWTGAKKTAIRNSRVAGTRLLVDAIAAAPERPAVLLSASAVGYYGNRGDEELTEDALPGEGFLADVCREWEAEAMRAEQWGVRVAMLRTGIVIGRGGGALEQMLPPFRLGLGGPVGSGRQWFPWIHLDDMVGLYLHALDHELSGPVNAAAPVPVRQGQFARAMGAALGRPAMVRTPRLALTLLYGEFADTLFEGQHALPTRALATGYTFRYPTLEPALAECVGS